MLRLLAWRPFLWALLAALPALTFAGARSEAQALLAVPSAAEVLPDPSFAGINLHQQAIDLASTAWPPSPSSAVGPTHVMELMNQSAAIFTRSGTRVQHVRLRDFLSVSYRNLTYTASFDPQVVFDRHSQRWFAACVGTGGSGNGALPDPVILAVSRSADPTGSWSKFLIPIGEGPAGNDAKFTTNLTLGVDGMGVYFGARIVPAAVTPEFCKLAVTPKASLVANRPSLGKITQFSPLTGLVASPLPATNLDAPGTGPAWVVASTADTRAGLRWWKVNWSRGTPTLSAPGDLATPAFGALPDAAQSGSEIPIETGDERLQSAVIRNGRLWTSRTIGVNASGTASGADRTGCEWFELNLGGSAPTVAQTGRVFDAGSSPRSYYFPTLSANSAGDAVLSFCGSKSTEFIGAYFTHRLHNETPGSMSEVQTLKAGEAVYTRTVGGNLLPFGRHGSVCIDPVDDFSFWSIQPYAALTPTPNAWGTWIGRLQLSEAPVPPGEARISPLSLKFGKVKVGKTKTKSFTITSRGDNPLLGTVNAASAPYLVTTGAGEFRLEPRQKLKVEVRFSPTVKGAVPPATLTLTTNDPEQPTVAISLTGAGK